MNTILNKWFNKSMVPLTMNKSKKDYCEPHSQHWLILDWYIHKVMLHTKINKYPFILACIMRVSKVNLNKNEIAMQHINLYFIYQLSTKLISLTFKCLELCIGFTASYEFRGAHFHFVVCLFYLLWSWEFYKKREKSNLIWKWPWQRKRKVIY